MAMENRNANGTFQKGHAGGPGNPYARRVAALRSALLAAVTEEDLRAIAATLVKQAKQGDMAALKLLLAYTEAPDPDRVDLEEARIAQDVTPCRVCDEGVLENGKPCPQCLGTGKLQASPELRGRMYAELAQYVAPKRRAMDVTVEDGDPARRELIDQAAAAILGLPIERGFATSQPLLSGGIEEDD
jgi:hypothetical protein